MNSRGSRLSSVLINIIFLSTSRDLRTKREKKSSNWFPTASAADWMIGLFFFNFHLFRFNSVFKVITL